MIKNYALIPQTIQRRHSFPPQIDLNLEPITFRSSPISSHQSNTVINNPPISSSSPLPMKLGATSELLKYINNVYPLTEENLAIHTKNFPPCKDARRRNARLFVENQRPVIEMELILEEQREQEIASFVPISQGEEEERQQQRIQFTNPFGGGGQQQQQQKKYKNWLKRLTHWIRLDSIKHNNESSRRHFSWSAGTEKEEEKKRQQQQRGTTTTASINDNGSSVLCQNQQQQQHDSGISMFSGKRRSAPSIVRSSASIPIARQPKFSPSQHDEFIAFKYPRMVHRRASHAVVDNDNHASYAHHERIRSKSPLDINHHLSITAA